MSFPAAPTSLLRQSPAAAAVWSVVAAFGAYSCMYAFRKPFTAAAFADADIWGMEQKSFLVVAQVLGYMTSKFIGIRVVAEMTPQRRVATILGLILSAEMALVAFGMASLPWRGVCLFVNGLSLGMFFGLVVGYLEGRRNTEALTAGLCASFIVADGATKSLGTWLLNPVSGLGVSEAWMPSLAGLFALPLLLLFVWMLSCVPPPNATDIALRKQRCPMSRAQRRELVERHWLGLGALVLSFLSLTVARSIRADFAPEIWNGLGTKPAAETFTHTELLVAGGVLVVSALSVWIVDNRRAFFVSLLVCMLGGVLMASALVGEEYQSLDGFTFMVLIGLGLYLPYVVMHTTVFERLIPVTGQQGNLGFLICLADAVGYLGYVAVLLAKNALEEPTDFLPFFRAACWVVAMTSVVSLAIAWAYFSRQTASSTAPQEAIA